MMNYFVSTELGTANQLQRRFDWNSNTLFLDEIPHARDPARTKFILANDDVVFCAPVSPRQTSLARMWVDDGMTTAHQEVFGDPWCP
jgi:hypothetical protein